ncbi:heparinase II/III family protein [Pelagibacterium lacus]|uniref:heparinase II/III family protein n=1 Tax=Pelagibacterium lacus TaxID=2282655 RepID=UPI000E092F7F|nr:heparinase II/III family protein [Pelagibacterium lacus]
MAVADRIVTHPLNAWTWSGSADTRFAPRLADFRPADSQTVVEMMEGKYLLAGETVETGGTSPFALLDESDAWQLELNGFGWLRHFAGVTDPGQRAFARTLVRDWLARHERFDRDIWGVFVTGRRVLNWLKAYALLTDGASPDQMRRLNRSLAIQLHSLKVRAGLSPDPMARIMAAIALAGAALSEAETAGDLDALVGDLAALLARTVDGDGLVITRNPLHQIQILVELIPVNQALIQRHGRLAPLLAQRMEAMHRALDHLVLGTREAAFFHGCGQVPVELVLSIGAQSGIRSSGSGLVGGYGVLVDGPGKLVADGGRLPPIEASRDAHASALAFEFACGSTLVAGNCGPAPAQLDDSRDLFRHTSAHSAPTIDDLSSATIVGRGPGREAALENARPGAIGFDAAENTLELRSGAYGERYGLDIVRRLTLMGGGQTLVGQDRFVAGPGRKKQQGAFSIRFHLAPGVVVERSAEEDLIRLVYRNGEVWTFLWEGAAAEIDDSVRHSAHFGLNRTRQIVLHGPAFDGADIAWVFTRQSQG